MQTDNAKTCLLSKGLAPGAPCCKLTSCVRRGPGCLLSTVGWHYTPRLSRKACELPTSLLLLRGYLKETHETVHSAMGIYQPVSCLKKLCLLLAIVRLAESKLELLH